MTSGIALFLAVTYVSIGWLCWRRIVVSPRSPCHAEEWWQELVEADARGDLALLCVKGLFVLTWPAALGIGWVTARLD